MESSRPAEPDVPGVVAFPPLIFAGGLAAGLLLDRLVPAPRFPPRPAARAASVVLLAAGGALVRSAFAAFDRAGTPVDPGETSTAIVTEGPYRFTRNPIYLGLAALFLGIATWRRSPLAQLALVPTLLTVQRGVVEREERYLERRFGASYLAYRDRVRRWL